MAKTNIMQIETEMIYYMCLNWINTLFKKNPDSYLKPVCLIARYIYFASNEVNQNIKKQGTVCFKEINQDMILNERKEQLKLCNNHIFTFDSIQHQQTRDVLSLVAFTNGCFDKLSLDVSNV